jgi:hypothetical protein
MNRLQLELHRLYLPRAAGSADAEGAGGSLIDADGRVRAMVLELARPADWHSIAKVWNGVQADLELPAPAIAVSGTDGYQLWFSLLEPVAVAQAVTFLEALRTRYLGDIRTERVGLMPAAGAWPAPGALHARPVPAPQQISGHWSAFVAPDLAPMFAEEPWLDMPPNDDGQSRLLSPLKSIAPADFQRALAWLGPAGSPPPPLAASVTSWTAGPAAETAGAATATPSGGLDPKEFLLGVMNDDAVTLGLRIEAAKALLPYFVAPERR